MPVRVLKFFGKRLRYYRRGEVERLRGKKYRGRSRRVFREECWVNADVYVAYCTHTGFDNAWHAEPTGVLAGVLEQHVVVGKTPEQALERLEKELVRRFRRIGAAMGYEVTD